MTTNVSAVDGWTWTHLATGFVSAKIGISLPWYVGLSIAYELIEHSMEFPGGSEFFGTKRPESKVNALVDVCVGALGYKLGTWA
jgi:hypothetical protein